MMIGFTPGVLIMSALCAPLLRKERDMSKLSKILFGLWIVLAIAAFVGAFFATPAIVRTLGIIFGILNMTLIMSWTASLIQAKKEYKKQKEMEG